jgi:hypothetical protein
MLQDIISQAVTQPGSKLTTFTMNACSTPNKDEKVSHEKVQAADINKNHNQAQNVCSALPTSTQTAAQLLTRATAALREFPGEACLLTAALLACRLARSSRALVLYCIDMVGEAGCTAAEAKAQIELQEEALLPLSRPLSRRNLSYNSVAPMAELEAPESCRDDVLPPLEQSIPAFAAESEFRRGESADTIL